MSEYSPKDPRIIKPKLTSQDVRNKVLALRDSLVLNLEFLQESIDKDHAHLKAYRKLHGDLYYRPVLSKIDGVKVYGDPTEVLMEPMAGKYRATIASLLQSIRLIENEIISEDDAEGASSSSSSEIDPNKRQSLRESFKTDAVSKAPVQPTETTEPREDLTETSPTELEVKLVEKPKTPPNHPNRPWRETTARSQPISTPTVQAIKDEAKAIVAQSTPKSVATSKGAIGLSPALRASLANGNRIDSIRERYGNGTSRVVSNKTDEEDQD